MRSKRHSAGGITDARADDVGELKRMACGEWEDEKTRKRRRGKTPNTCGNGDAAIKRKASPEREESRERDGASCTAGDPTDLSDYEVEEVELTGVKRKASAAPVAPSEGTVENGQPKVNTSRGEQKVTKMVFACPGHCAKTGSIVPSTFILFHGVYQDHQLC